MKKQKFSEKEIQRYERAGYRFLGENKHSAIQMCRWAKSSLKGKRNCYKKIFGIKAHRCIQISPTLDLCPFSCTFCWRSFSPKRFKASQTWDSPEQIVKDAITQQKLYLSGFKASQYVTKKRMGEALSPNHFAISLDGEPTLYPHLPKLIKEIKSTGSTVFLVTNGMFPNRLKSLIKNKAMPDNMSISIYATNPKDYQSITNSFIPSPLTKIKQSLKLLKEFKTSRTNLRLTLIRNLNMHDIEGYANLIKLAKPKFITIKGYSYLGESQKRLKISDMPYMHELLDFSKQLVKHTGYKIFHKDKVSRVIILIKDSSVIKFNKAKIKEQKLRFLKANKK